MNEPTKMFCVKCRKQAVVEVRDEFPAPKPSTDTIIRYQCASCGNVCGTEHQAQIEVTWPQANITHRQEY